MKKLIDQYNSNNQKDGYWEDYYYNGDQVHSKGNFKDGKKDGYWED